MDLKLGDVVKLKTGGPRMCVDTLHPEDADESNGERKVGTIWFEPRATPPSGLTAAPMWDGPFTGVFAVETLDAAA